MVDSTGQLNFGSDHTSPLASPWGNPELVNRLNAAHGSVSFSMICDADADASDQPFRQPWLRYGTGMTNEPHHSLMFMCCVMFRIAHDVANLLVFDITPDWKPSYGHCKSVVQISSRGLFPCNDFGVLAIVRAAPSGVASRELGES